MLGKTNAIPTLAVTDIAIARDFYGNALGFDEIHSFLPDKTDAFYRVGEESYIYVYERPEPSGSTATACAFSVDDVDRVVETLRARGVRFEEYDLPELGLKTVNGVAYVGSVKTAWFKDPSGNILAVDDSLSVFARQAHT